MSDNLLLDTLCVNEKNEDGEGIVYSDKISLHLSEFTGYILIQSEHQYRSDDQHQSNKKCLLIPSS